MYFRNFITTYVFEVKEFISSSFTKLPCSGDLENPDQLPVLQELQGTDGWVLWIFIISSCLTFSRWRNLLGVVSQSYHVWMTSKIQVNFRFRRYSRVLSIGSRGFQYFFIPYVFDVKESVFRSFTRPSCSGDLENPGQLPVWQELEGILTVGSHGFS